MANRVVETLSRLFYMEEAWGVAPEGGNPCRFVKKYQDRSCERFLSEQEFRRRGAGHRRLNAAFLVLAAIDQELTKDEGRVDGEFCVMRCRAVFACMSIAGLLGDLIETGNELLESVQERLQRSIDRIAPIS